MEIKSEDLCEWQQKNWMVYASSTKERKKLVCSLSGYFEVIVGNAIVWRGRDAGGATNKYNSIT